MYVALRPLLLSIAYDMVGAVGGAEDIVQEAFLRFHREVADGTEFESPKAWLATVTTRLAINHVRSARVRRESYVGTWLPEPLLTDAAPDAAAQVETADALSMAFLVLLERLTPVERAVFIFRDVFDFGFDEIADIVGKSEDNCRQIAVRARRRVQERKPRFEVSRKRRQELAERFFEAVGEGKTDDLVGRWRPTSSSTPMAAARGRPSRIRCTDSSASCGFSAAINRRSWGSPAPRRGDQWPAGPRVLRAESRAVVVIALDIAGGQVVAVRTISNPEKLRHLDERPSLEHVE